MSIQTRPRHLSAIGPAKTLCTSEKSFVVVVFVVVYGGWGPTNFFKQTQYERGKIRGIQAGLSQNIKQTSPASMMYVQTTESPTKYHSPKYHLNNTKFYHRVWPITAAQVKVHDGQRQR